MNSEAKSMTIGELARAAGVNVQTIRYYERQKLLPKPRRREAGYRQYGSDEAERLQFILRAKAVGFTLKEISGLLALRLDPETGCEEVQHIAEEALNHIESKLNELKRFHAALTKLVHLCRQKGSASVCPILDLLEKNF